MDAENTHRVFEGLWSSGQLSADDIARLPGMGIDVVINLALPSSPNALSGEAELVAREGLAYVQIPVEWESPEPAQLAQFFGVLGAFAGCNVWVHCARNMRVSAFLYLYRRIVLGEDDEAAAHPMRAVWQPNGVWQAFIRDALARAGLPECPEG